MKEVASAACLFVGPGLIRCPACNGWLAGDTRVLLGLGAASLVLCRRRWTRIRERAQGAYRDSFSIAIGVLGPATAIFPWNGLYLGAGIPVAQVSIIFLAPAFLPKVAMLVSVLEALVTPVRARE